jgi:hypothetical protein
MKDHRIKETLDALRNGKVGVSCERDGFSFFDVELEERAHITFDRSIRFIVGSDGAFYAKLEETEYIVTFGKGRVCGYRKEESLATGTDPHSGMMTKGIELGPYAQLAKMHHIAATKDRYLPKPLTELLGLHNKDVLERLISECEDERESGRVLTGERDGMHMMWYPRRRELHIVSKREDGSERCVFYDIRDLAPVA